jgi:hypothetical protein
MGEGFEGSTPPYTRNAGSKSGVADGVMIAFFGDCAAKGAVCQVFCGPSSDLLFGRFLARKVAVSRVKLRSTIKDRAIINFSSSCV